MENSIAVKERNRGWHVADSQVLSALYNLLNETGIVPSYTQIAQKCGLTYETVRKHLCDKSVTDFAGDYKQHIPGIIESLAVLAKNGDVPAARLYLQVSGFSEKTMLDATVKSDTTLQVRFVSPDDDLSEVTEYDILSEDDEELPAIDTVDKPLDGQQEIGAGDAQNVGSN